MTAKKYFPPHTPNLQKKKMVGFIDTKIKLQEMGQMMLITDKLIESTHAAKLLEIINQRRLSSLVEFLVVNQQRVFPDTDRSVRIERDFSLRAFELSDVYRTEDDLRLSAIIARQSKEQVNLINAISSINNLSWYKILWRRVRRQPLVTFNAV